ncbi:MAG TPA: hypothetical protein VNM40_00825 [Candidatus Paceibacterota bacterium]|nr:hypothetical protein [Candidatus Paceibacterota bacterium]
MKNFLIGLVVALAIAAGLYYFLLQDAARQSAVDDEIERGAAIDLQINEANRIPPGVMMEDGAIPE